MHVHLTILTISNIKDKDSGSYKVMAFNTEGSAESTASLLVSLKEEQEANSFSLSRRSDRSCSSLDSLVDQTKERKFRVDLRCVGSPFDKTTKEQSRGHHRHKSSLYRTMYFRTLSPSRAPEKDRKFETASECARSPPPMFERPERFSDRYSDIYCDRFTGRDRSSDRFSDKFSDRCSDRYSDRFSDTESLHGEVRAKLHLLQKAVKKKKRLSVSTMSSTEFDLESVTSETSYTDFAEKHRVKPTTLTDLQHACQSDQVEGALSRRSADFQSRLERITELGTQSVEPTQSRVKHSFEPQSRSRAIQMMRGELPLEDIRTKETNMIDISEIKMDETAISKEETTKEVEYNISVGTDSILGQWEKEAKAKEPFVLQWLEAGEVSQNIPKEIQTLHEESTIKEPSSSKPLMSVKETFLGGSVPQNGSKLVPIQQLQPRAMSIENVLEKNLESECLETEEQFLAKRIRKWQEDVQTDEIVAGASERSEAKGSSVHKLEDKMLNEPLAVTQKVFSFTMASPKDEDLIECEAQQKAGQGSESEVLISEDVILAQPVAWQQGYAEVVTEKKHAKENANLHKPDEKVNQKQTVSQRGLSFTNASRSLAKEQCPDEHDRPNELISDSSFTNIVRTSDKEKFRPEQGTQCERHSSQVEMSEIKSGSVLLVGEGETLTQEVMKWQHDEAEGVTQLWSKDKEPHVHKAEYEIQWTEPSTLTERGSSSLVPTAKEKPSSDHETHSELFLMQDQMTLKNRTDHIVSGKETIVQPVRKWNQRHVDTEKASHFHRSEGEKYKKAPAVVPQRDSSFIKVSSSAKEKHMHEHGPRRESHLSRERINELKSKSECYVNEEEALTQRIMKWQHDVLSEQEHAVPLDPDWVTSVGNAEDTAANKDVEPSKSSQSLPKRTTKEMLYTDNSTEDYELDTSNMQMQFQNISHEDGEKLQTESDYLVSEEEALATRIKKWQQDILTEQEQEENVELESNWTITEHLQTLTQKTDDGLEVVDPSHCGMTSKALFEVDKTSTHVYHKDLPQDKSDKWTESQKNPYEKVTGYLGAAKDMEICSMTEHKKLLSKQEPTTILDETVKAGAPGFLTTLLPNIKVRRGEMTDLQCQFHGDPKPVVCWLKDGQAIIRDPDFDVRTREKSSTLTIYYPTKDHQGKFTCNISNKHGKASMSCMLEVTDDEHKDWPETPQEVKVTEELVLAEEQIVDEELESFMNLGVDKKFSLQVPHPVIHVPCLSDSYTHSSPVEIRVTAPTPVLDTNEDIFEPIAKTTDVPPDEGTSQTMKHKFTFSFDVVGEAPQILKQLEDISCSEGQTAMLECIISGEPSPDVTWLHDDLSLDPSRGKYKLDEHDKIYRLYIHKFTYLDAGTYRCTATNRFGQVQSVAHVFFGSTTLGNIGPLSRLEMTEQTRSAGFSSNISPAVRPKTLIGTSVASKELPAKGEECAYEVYKPVTTEEYTESPMNHFIPVTDAPSVLQKGAAKFKHAAQSGEPVITGCGLQSSGAEVSVSKLKQAFETPKSLIVEPDDITVESHVESFYPVEDIPEFALQIQQHVEGMISSNMPGNMLSSIDTCKESPLRSTPDVTEIFITKNIAPSIEEISMEGKQASSDLHHFVSLAHVTEVQHSPTLIRPQAILPGKTRNVTDTLGSPEIKTNQVENVIKKGTVGAFIRPGGSHLVTDSSAFSTQEIPLLIKPNEVELPVQSKTDTISQGENYYKLSNIESFQGGTQEAAGTLRNVAEIAKSVRVKQKSEGTKKGSVQDFATESLQQQQQKAVNPGAAGIRLEEEEVTFNAVYDFYNPPSDWGRPLSPESEMSIEVGSTFSEEIAEIERFYTPASSTEISQFPKSPESFHTSTETPSGAMTPPEYPFSPGEHKRPPSSSSDGLYSPAKFFRSPDDEGIETTPPVFTIDENMILPEGRDLLGLGSLQEKVQGIPPAFLKPLTKKRVFEGDTLRFCAEVFGLPSPEVKWFRNKTRLVPDDRTRIERDGDNISLEIHNIAKTDQGEYICEAVNYVGEAKSVALVVVRSQETKIMLSPPAVTHQHVIEFDVEEDEDPSRSPSPQEILLEVELDENEVKEFEKQVKIVTIPEYTSDNKSMIISLDVLPSTYDEGTVDFIAQENDDYKIAFEVTEMPPRFINPICDIETPENTTVMFECSLMGIPSPIVSWFKGNMKIPHDKKKYIHSSDGDNHFLKILKINTQDSGIYTCRAINVVGETLCRASLMVLNPQACSGKARGRELTAVSLGSAIVQPQKFDLVVGNSSFDGEQPSEIELEFEFPQEADESQKAVRLVAMTDNEVSEQGQKYVSINFDVYAEPSKEDKIEFKGKSTNMCSFHFQVTETPPKCIIPLQNVTAAVGTPVMLQCLVSGKPNPTAEWFKDGAPVTNPRYIIQEKASGHFNLLITNAVQSDAGEFKCIILNKAGSTETVALLKVI
ncbi:hypothetical protein PDJAM_G00216300 [Pangasius djambal]|uniref:Uncharacterized protein n=1 Tax=Pangasius djambal TaxID=1691987 RepID=A0ACC5YB30_9TELE|nr:hypothetical protein [Pangasius djambal]